MDLSSIRGLLLVFMAPLASKVSIISHLLGVNHEESVQSLVLKEFLQRFLGVLVGYFGEDVR
jgi:hypothetical protein